MKTNVGNNSLSNSTNKDVMLSVVIPIHNAENTIEKCLQSVLEQDYLDMEIILIDDGSTDRSAEVCDKFIENDKRFNYIYQEDSWLSASRNNGMRNAKGKYLVFLDPDDYWEKDLCSTVISYMEKFYLDVAQFGLFFERSENDKDIYRFTEKDEIYELNEDILLSFVCRKWLYPKWKNTIWSKMFRRDFLNNVGINFVEEIRGFEDFCFWGMLIPHIKRIGFIHKPLYHYCQHVISGTHAGAKKLCLFKEDIRVFDLVMENWSDEVKIILKPIIPIIFLDRVKVAMLCSKRVHSEKEIPIIIHNSINNRINMELSYENILHAVNLYAIECDMTWREKMMLLMFGYSLLDGEKAIAEWQEMYNCLTLKDSRKLV